MFSLTNSGSMFRSCCWEPTFIEAVDVQAQATWIYGPMNSHTSSASEVVWFVKLVFVFPWQVRVED